MGVKRCTECEHGSRVFLSGMDAAIAHTVAPFIKRDIFVDIRDVVSGEAGIIFSMVRPPRGIVR